MGFHTHPPYLSLVVTQLKFILLSFFDSSTNSLRNSKWRSLVMMQRKGYNSSHYRPTATNCNVVAHANSCVPQDLCISGFSLLHQHLH